MAITTEIAPRINGENNFTQSVSESWGFPNSRQILMNTIHVKHGLIASEPPDTNEFPMVSAETAVVGGLSNAVVHALIRRICLGYNGRVISPGQLGLEALADLLSGPVSVPQREWVYEKPALTPTEIAKLFSIKSAAEETAAPLPPVIAEFAAGVEGYPQPERRVAEMGAALARAAGKLSHTEFSVDVDGALSIDLLLPDGCRVMAELTVDGRLFASVYDPDGERVNRLRDATAAEFAALL